MKFTKCSGFILRAKMSDFLLEEQDDFVEGLRQPPKSKNFPYKSLNNDLERPSFEELFYNHLMLWRKRSPCVKTKQCAILVRDTRIISTGYNGPPPGVPNCNESGGEAYCGKDMNGSCFLGIHAEANCLAYAARKGIRTEGCDMWITMSPCIHCAKLIAAAGIKKVYYLEDYRIVEGKQFLQHTGVKIAMYKDGRIIE